MHVIILQFFIVTSKSALESAEVKSHQLLRGEIVDVDFLFPDSSPDAELIVAHHEWSELEALLLLFIKAAEDQSWDVLRVVFIREFTAA